MQSVSSRIWTRVAVSISYDDNHYTTGLSIPIVFNAYRILSVMQPSHLVASVTVSISVSGGNVSLYRKRWIEICCILAFDLAKNSIPRWCTGRKGHILMAVRRGNRVGGNWLMKWDEVKKFPWYTHRLMHRKRVTSELHDSYFRWMTINHAIPKIE